MTTDHPKYYQSYEDRYRRVYSQGVDHWTGDPDEIATIVGQLDQFLQSVGARPVSHRIIEFGCGEGVLGEHLLQMGYSYLGIDLSPSALEKARSRIPRNDGNFVLGDITGLLDVQGESFDIALDNYCLQMLVTDEDRCRYLAEVYRVLKPGGRAWFREIAQRERFTDNIEFGCGEGVLGEHLLQMGYSYLGIDLSPSALEKARSRIPRNDGNFVLGDITGLLDVQGESFDIALDNYCLQMLVTDEDRCRYLAEVYRVLKPGGRAWFREIAQRERFTDNIESFDDFLAKHPTDLCTCEAREACSASGRKTIQLPRVPARFNNCEGYREEIRAIGFDVELAQPRKGGIVVYVRKPGELAEPSAAGDADKPRA